MTAKELMALIRASGKPFYCYVLCDLGEPFYVGIGRARRALCHVSDAKKPTIPRSPKLHKIRSILEAGRQVEYRIAGWFDDWALAQATEITLISHYGRRDLGTGKLFNAAAGGDGAAGRPYKPRSAEARAKMSAAAKARVWTEKQRDAVRANIAGQNVKAGAITAARWKDPTRVDAHAAERKARGQRLRERLADSEFRAVWDQKRLEAHKAPETRAKRHETALRVFRDPAFRAMAAKRMRAKWQDPEYRAARAANRKKK